MDKYLFKNEIIISTDLLQSLRTRLGGSNWMIFCNCITEKNKINFRIYYRRMSWIHENS